MNSKELLQDVHLKISKSSAIQVVQERSHQQSWTILAAMACQARCALQGNNGIIVVGLTNCFMITFEACSLARNWCLVL